MSERLQNEILKQSIFNNEVNQLVSESIKIQQDST